MDLEIDGVGACREGGKLEHSLVPVVELTAKERRAPHVENDVAVLIRAPAGVEGDKNSEVGWFRGDFCDLCQRFLVGLWLWFPDRVVHQEEYPPGP